MTPVRPMPIRAPRQAINRSRKVAPARIGANKRNRLDPAFCAQLLSEMEQMEQALRSSGQFGARIEVPSDADTQTRLLGFIGRDPFWSGREP